MGDIDELPDYPEGEDNAPLMLLALDGGGVRGASELVILEELMHRIRFKIWTNQKKQNPRLKFSQVPEPKPCDYFDLCGGTSTGGIIAILLARLRLPVSVCLEIYGKLSQDIFPPASYLSSILNYKGLVHSRFDHRILTRAIQDTLSSCDLVDSQDRRPDAPLLTEKSGPERRCHAFVTATPYNAAQRNQPRLFRTYQARSNVQMNGASPMIWEAARATSAAPTFFDPITIKLGEAEETFVDGGFGCNNPVFQVLQEAQNQFPGRQIGCLVSIGTGMPAVREVRDSANVNIFQRMAFSLTQAADQITVYERIATTCEVAHQEMSKRALSDPDLEGRYYRFNVQQGTQYMSLERWDMLGELRVYTQAYIESQVIGGTTVNSQLQKLAGILYAHRRLRAGEVIR